MAPPLKLTGERRKALISEVPDWIETPGRDAISRTFVFQDFKQAWWWMTRVAELADQRDHHPEWFNVYNRVEVVLSTHDCAGLSHLDIEMAKSMNQLYAQRV